MREPASIKDPLVTSHRKTSFTVRIEIRSLENGDFAFFITFTFATSIGQPFRHGKDPEVLFGLQLWREVPSPGSTERL
jgi:hypothetical protein